MHWSVIMDVWNYIHQLVQARKVTIEVVCGKRLAIQNPPQKKKKKVTIEVTVTVTRSAHSVYITHSALNMSALRLASSAARRVPTTLGRRGYAEIADKIKLSLVLPHQVCYPPLRISWQALNYCRPYFLLLMLPK